MISALDSETLGGDSGGGPVRFGFTTEKAPKVENIASYGVLTESANESNIYAEDLTESITIPAELSLYTENPNIVTLYCYTGASFSICRRQYCKN